MNLEQYTEEKILADVKGLQYLYGLKKVIRYAQNFGFGQMTGINLPGEDAGFIPEEFSTLMSSHGDGFGVTALQLASFTAAIANGGNLYIPRVPKTAQEAANFKPQLRRKIEMTVENRLRMLAAMASSVPPKTTPVPTVVVVAS